MRILLQRFAQRSIALRAFSRYLGLCVVLMSASMALQADEVDISEEPPVPQVDINAADAETLALALDGVGEARAMDIIAYREENGPFETVEELQQVSGIGPATVERNRDRVMLSTQ